MRMLVGKSKGCVKLRSLVKGAARVMKEGLPHPGAKSKSMQRGLATAVFEFLARSARTRIVAPDFWHSTSKCSGANMLRLFANPLRFEIPINPGHPAAAPTINFSRSSSVTGSEYGRISRSGSCSCASTKIGTTHPPCSSSSKRSARPSLRNSIPRVKPFAQSLARAIPLSSGRTNGR
jgi:hypothetical protein